MKPLLTLARWLDIRPHEYRTFTISALGAFFVITYVVVARSLREAFFLDTFSIELIPYVTIATSVVSLPSVGAFSRLISRHDPRRVYGLSLAVTALGLLMLWMPVTYFKSYAVPVEAPLSYGAQLTVEISTVIFYLWTAVSSFLLTSGFWMVSSEYFALRDAKRLFGIIGGAGTTGAMFAAVSVSYIAGTLGLGALVLGLVATLGLMYALQRALPDLKVAAHKEQERGDTSVRESLQLVLEDKHLRTLAAIVAVATMASFMIDYQFKEAADLYFETDEELTSFFATFYGVAGVASLALQVFVASRLLASAGVAWTLSILPLILLMGSTALLLVPAGTLLVSTLVRGADNSVRKSLHRSVIEYLYVPVPSLLRRKTKTFIDSFVDSAAEGLAALIVLVWVTGLALPARGLSLFVVALALGLLGLTRVMGAQYFQTLLLRLREGQQEIQDEDQLVQTQFVTGGQMGVSMTMTQFDMQTLMTQTGVVQTGVIQTGVQHTGVQHTGVQHAPATAGRSRPEPRPKPRPTAAPDSTGARIAHADPAVVSKALDEAKDWQPGHVPTLVRLLARDAFYRRAARILAKLGRPAVEPLGEILLSEDADFVIRRRIPRVLAAIDDPGAEDALRRSLSGRRFEVRYRSGVALARRRKKRRAEGTVGDEPVWAAIRAEVHHERPIWELQRLLDERPGGDEFVSDRVYGRGELSLEHTFRLLSLVLDPAPVRTAFHGVVLDDDRLKSISLEYLEQVLPPDIKERLWPFIGDISEHQLEQAKRGVDEVAADLLKTGATLFASEAERAKLREALKKADEDG